MDKDITAPRERSTQMYNKVETSVNFVEREKEVEKFWRENDIFQKSMDARKSYAPTHQYSKAGM